MRVLVATLLMREPDGRAKLYGRALQSVFNLRWQGALETIQVIGDDDYARPAETVTRKYNLARDVFLRGDYTHLLTVEHDMIVPPDALEKLAALDCDIAYGLYVLRHGRREWSAFTHLEHDYSLSLSEAPALARDMWGKTINVAGVGMGCTLMRRHVVEDEPFSYWRGVDCDWWLGNKAQQKQWTQKADLSVICGHMTMLPSPRVYYPDIDAPDLVRTDFL